MTASEAHSARARGALLGLALGDAIGMPALYHRSVHLGSRRGCLWDIAAKADARSIYRHPMPFTVADSGELALGGTDDAEMAAVVAGILLQDDPRDATAFAKAWRTAVDDNKTWLGVSDRIALSNLREGLQPPASGAYNPAAADDAAVIRAVPVAIRHCRDADAAARLAGEFASVTHGAETVLAARAMARLVALLIGGADPAGALRQSIAAIPADSWLGRNTARAMAIADAAQSLFAAIPVLSDEVANQTYSYGSISTETFPVACAIASRSQSMEQAVAMAALIPKQSDSMPAMVGAIMGAAPGDAAIPLEWTSRVDRLRGNLFPAAKGLRLLELAQGLLDAGDARRVASDIGSTG